MTSSLARGLALTTCLATLFPPREQRPGEVPVYAVGRLRRLDGSRGLLIHAVEIAPLTIEIRHRLAEPDGPCVIVGTLQDGAGWLDLNADDEQDPYEVWAAIRRRRRHAGWKLVVADRKRA